MDWMDLSIVLYANPLLANSTQNISKVIQLLNEFHMYSKYCWYIIFHSKIKTTKNEMWKSCMKLICKFNNFWKVKLQQFFFWISKQKFDKQHRFLTHFYIFKVF